MQQDTIYRKLQLIFADIFLRDDIELSATTAAPDIAGWDSFRQIEIIMAVEEQFQIKLHTRDIDKLENVGNLVEVIEEKLALNS